MNTCSSILETLNVEDGFWKSMFDRDMVRFTRVAAKPNKVQVIKWSSDIMCGNKTRTGIL